MNLNSNRSELLGRIAISLIVAYVMLLDMYNGCLKAIPDIHTYLLLPIFLFFVFCVLFYVKNGVSFSVLSLMAMPFVVLTACCFLFDATEDRFMLWGICCIILLLSCAFDLDTLLPLKMTIGIGLFHSLFIIFSLVFKEAYFDIIERYFVNYGVMVNFIKSGYGYPGFCHNVIFTSFYLFVAEGASLVLLFFSWEDKRKRALNFLLLLFFVFCIFLTGSRGSSLVAVLLSASILLLDRRTRRFCVCLIVFGFLCLCVLCSVMIIVPSVFEGIPLLERLANSLLAFKNGYDVSSGRVDLWRKAIEVFKCHPVWGIGINSYWYYSETSMQVHNAYLQVLCEQGLIGFTLFIVPFVYSLVLCLKNYNRIQSPKGRGAMAFVLFMELKMFFESFIENTLATDYCGLVFFYIAIAALSSILVKEGLIKSYTLKLDAYDKLCNKILSRKPST